MRKYIFFISFFLIFLVFYPLPINADVPVKVGIYQNEPLVSTASDGAIKGIYIDVIEHVASKEGWDILYVAGTWPQCLERLVTGQIDILVGIAYSKERDKYYDFTNP